MIASVRLLNLLHLPRRPLRTSLTVLVIGAGVTLLVAVLIAQASLSSALARFNEQTLGSATLQISGESGPAGVDESAVERAQAVDGVRAAVPVVQALTIAEDSGGGEIYVAALGVDCRIEELVGERNCETWFAPGSEVVPELSTPLLSPTFRRRLGDDGVVRSNVGPLPIRSAITLDFLDDLNGGRIAIFRLDVAQELFSRDDALDTVLVVPDPGTDHEGLKARLAEAVGDALIVHEPRVSGALEGWVMPLFFLLSLLALLLGLSLAHNAVALSLEERRRDLAVTGALGAPRRALLTGSLVEAVVLGVAGGALGVAGGVVVAHPLVSYMSDRATRLTGMGMGLTVPLRVVLGGIAVGVAVAMASSLRPAWRASRADISADLGGRDTPGLAGPPPARRLVAFALLAVGGVALAWAGQRDGALRPWQPVVAQAGLVVAMVFAGLTISRSAAGLLGLITSRLAILRRGVAGLAVDNLVGDPRRTGAVTQAVAAAVALGVIVGAVAHALPARMAQEVAQETRGAVDVSGAPPINRTDLALRPGRGLRAWLAQRDDVAAVTADHGLWLDDPARFGSSRVGVVARDGPALASFPVLRGDPVEEVLERGEAVIGPGLARDRGLAVGDTFEVDGRSGVARLRVGAVWAWGYQEGRSITLPFDRFERIWGRQPPVAVLVTPTSGTSTGELAARLERELPDHDANLTARGADELADDMTAEVAPFLTPFVALQRSMMGVALVAALSTLLLVGMQRRREYGVLTAVGVAPAGLARMVLVEAGMVGMLGTVLGLAGGVVGGLAVAFVLPTLVGIGGLFALDLGAVAVYGLLTTACVVVGSALPAWRAARLDVATALRYE